MNEEEIKLPHAGYCHICGSRSTRRSEKHKMVCIHCVEYVDTCQMCFIKVTDNGDRWNLFATKEDFNRLKEAGVKCEYKEHEYGLFDDIPDDVEEVEYVDIVVAFCDRCTKHSTPTFEQIINAQKDKEGNRMLAALKSAVFDGVDPESGLEPDHPDSILSKLGLI